MVLFRATIVVQQDRGGPVSNAPGISAPRTGYNEPPPRWGTSPCVRSAGLRPARRGFGCKNTASQGRQKAWCQVGQLVDTGASKSAIAGAECRGAPREA